MYWDPVEKSRYVTVKDQLAICAEKTIHPREYHCVTARNGFTAGIHSWTLLCERGGETRKHICAYNATNYFHFTTSRRVLPPDWQHLHTMYQELFKTNLV